MYHSLHLQDLVLKAKVVAIIFLDKNSVFCRDKVSELKKLFEKNNILSFELDSKDYIHYAFNYFIDKTSLPTTLFFKDGKYVFKAEHHINQEDIKFLQFINEN